jgi:protein-S-isoprenylcysteine O-methyltransferase Ste14
MELLRIYLLCGLIGHKLVWEVLKRGRPYRHTPAPGGLRLVKAAKMAVLAGILVQSLLPFYVLPLSEAPQALQVAGVLLYTTGLVTAITARWQLGSNWSDIESAGVLDRHEVVAAGAYRYVRHPIYTGDLFLLLGLELALNSWLIVGVVALAAVVFRKAVREEKMLAARLPGYEAYCRRTKRFIPFLV